MTQAPADLCVIGAGAAGALVAASAAERGMSVVLLEAGERYAFADRAAQLERYLASGHPPWSPVPRRDAFVNGSDFPYDLNTMRVKGVGGSTLHWDGVAERLMVSDFETATRYGRAVDWPISYADLEPWYGRAERELGVSGSSLGLRPRSTPHPMPAFPDAWGDQRWRRAAERLGIQLGPISYAKNSVPYQGRSPCVAWGVCTLCPSGARYSADWHVELAERTGRCTVVTGTSARRIEVDASGRVRAVHTTTLDGRERAYAARHVVVAAHAVESARLLMLSGIGAHADQVGRHLMEHWYVSAEGLAPTRGWPGRIGFPILESFAWYDGDDRRDRGAFKVEVHDRVNPLLSDLSSEAPRWGRAAVEHDCRTFGYALAAEASCEHAPNRDSRVTLDPVTRDGFGDPVPNVRFVRTADDERTMARARRSIGELLEAADVRDPAFSATPFGVAHHMGTCRMSRDPERGVVDADLRVHGLENLWVVGSSVFPTGGAVPPTLTVAALALRLADHLRRRPT